MGTGEGRDYFWDIFRSNSLYCAGFIRMVRSFWRLAGWMMVIQPSPYGFLLTSSGASDKLLLISRTRPEMGRSEERRVGKECRSGWWRDDGRRNIEDNVDMVVV